MDAIESCGYEGGVFLARKALEGEGAAMAPRSPEAVVEGRPTRPSSLSSRFQDGLFSVRAGIVRGVIGWGERNGTVCGVHDTSCWVCHLGRLGG